MSNNHNKHQIWRDIEPTDRKEIIDFLKVSERPTNRERDVTEVLLASLALRLSKSYRAS